MFVTHQKIKSVHGRAHTGCRRGATSLGSISETNLTVLQTSFDFWSHKEILPQEHLDGVAGWSLCGNVDP